MSRKNHRIVNGRLIQTDKRYSALKQSQKQKINEWLYEEYAELYKTNNIPPDSRYNEYILDNVYGKIENAEIWLPFHELKKYFIKRKSHFKNRYEKQKSGDENVQE